MTPRQPDPFAFLAAHSLLRMGLTPVTDQDWVAPFSAAEQQAFYQHKLSVLSRNPNALLLDEQALPPLEEFDHALQQHLAQDHPAISQPCTLQYAAEDVSPAQQRFQRMTLSIPDDICILQADHAQEYLLTAASVLSPSLWHPAAKFLQPLGQIHHAIPEFDQKLMPSVSRFFRHIKPGMPVVRFNWAIQRGDALERLPGADIQGDAGLFYRSERQTLLRLQCTGAVVFLIRTRLCELSRLEEMSGDPSTLGRLLDHISGLSPAERHYKGLTELQSALDEYRKTAG